MNPGMHNPSRSGNGEAGRILIVDDQPSIRDILVRQMRSLGHETIEAANGQEAIERVAAERPDLVLLDIEMPLMDGFDVLGRLRSQDATADIPVVVISAEDDMRSITRCIELGADDYMVKPFSRTILQARVGTSLEKKRMRDREREYQRQIEEYNTQLEDKVRAQVEQISTGQLATIFALSKLAESRDPVTGLHLERMREYCRVLATELKQHPGYRRTVDDRFIENLYIASPLHDIGKVGVPDYILLKPAKLTPHEASIMQTHTLIGANTLREVSERHPGNLFLDLGISVAETHHERWDGKGYPFGIAGTDIPLVGRILAVCDVYDALTSRRVYKEPYPHERSRTIIVGKRGEHLDPDMVDAFLAVEARFVAIQQSLGDDLEAA